MSISLSSIQRTRRARPPKIVIAGPGGVGKTTFAAGAPNSIGILTEEGADAVDAQAFPPATSLSDVYSAIGVLLQEQHDFQSVWLDSLDWAEPLVWRHVCEANGWSSIEEPGYGKGYIAAAAEWRNLLDGFEALRAQKNMAVILICHDKLKHIDSPIDEGYDSYQLKLHDRAGAMVIEWADVVGWASYEQYTQRVKTVDKTEEAKARATGRRLLHVEPNPAHMAKTRFPLKNMELGWSHFIAALNAAHAAQPAAVAA